MKTKTEELALRRDPRDAAVSCRIEGWLEGHWSIHAIFTQGDAVRVIIKDGRSGTVHWDMSPEAKP